MTSINSSSLSLRPTTLSNPWETFKKNIKSWFSDEDITKQTFLDEQCYGARKNPIASPLALQDNADDLSDILGSLSKGIASNPNLKPSEIANVRSIDTQGRTLFHYAVMEGKIDCCNFFLKDESGEIFCQLDRNSRSVLHYAMMYYNPAIIRLLLQSPKIHKIINLKDYLRKTPLNTSFIDDLHQKQVGFFTTDADNDFTVREYVDVIIDVVKAGGDLLIHDISRRNALDRLSKRGLSEELVMRGILKEGLSPWCEYLSRLKSPLRLLNKLFKFDQRAYDALIEIDPRISLLQKSFYIAEPPASAAPPSHPMSIERDLRDTSFSASEEPPQSCLYLILRKQLQEQSRHILLDLLCLYCNLERCLKTHITEADEIKQYSTAIQQMIFDLFHCESMEFPLNVQKLLQPNNLSLMTSASKEPLLLIQAKAYLPDSVLSYALQKQLKLLFMIPEITVFTSELFISSIRKECLVHLSQLEEKNSLSSAPSLGALASLPPSTPKSHPHSSFATKSQYEINNNLKDLNQLSLNLRFCPLASFTLRFFSKIVLLILISRIAYDYSVDYSTDYSDDNRRTRWVAGEVWLLIFTIAEILYEVGYLLEEILDHPNRSFFTNTNNYIKKHRNIVELSILCGIILWSFLRIRSTTINKARVVISLISIPQAISLLRYLSIYQPLGELILVIQFIVVQDIFLFAIIYFVIVIGFGVTLFTLFHTNMVYRTTLTMFFQLFEYTLNNFDFSNFTTNSEVVNIFGCLILISYLVLTSIILMNVLIARLTNTYESVSERAVSEWCYMKAQQVNKHLNFREKNPLKVVPPPFNIIPILFSPFHYYYLYFHNKKNQEDKTQQNTSPNVPTNLPAPPENKQEEEEYQLSIAGTISNMIYTIYLGSWIRIYSILRFYIHHLSTKCKNFKFTNPSDYFFWLFAFPFSIASLMFRLIGVPLTPLVLWEETVEWIDDKGNFDFLQRCSAQSSNNPSNNTGADPGSHPMSAPASDKR